MPYDPLKVKFGLRARGVPVSGVETPRQPRVPERLPEPERRRQTRIRIAILNFGKRWDKFVATETARNQVPPHHDALPQPGLMQIGGNGVAGIVGLANPETGNTIRDDASNFRTPAFKFPASNPFT